MKLTPQQVDVLDALRDGIPLLRTRHDLSRRADLAPDETYTCLAVLMGAGYVCEREVHGGPLGYGITPLGRAALEAQNG